MNPNPQTAIILDQLLSHIRVCEQELDFQDANVEFALGKSNVTRHVDLCWGIAPTTARQRSDLTKHLLVSPGQVRIDNGGLAATTTAAAYSFESYLGDHILEKVYAFGSVYYQATGNAIDVSFVGQDQLDNNHIYLVQQDYDLDTAENMFLTGIVEPYIPTGDFELFRFILDVQYFDPNDSSRNIIRVRTIDLRKIRGYGGFSEESLAVNVVPSLILSKKNNHDLIQNIKDSYKNLVRTWVTLSSWSPNFIDYWQSNFDLMPPGLREYLFVELGVLINNPPPAWGINANLTLVSNVPTQEELALVQASGAQVARISVGWAQIETTLGVYDFTACDAYVSAYINAGFKPIFILAYNNPLYTSFFENGVSSAPNRTAWVNWATAVVNRYQGLGIIWELWNEPNLDHFWQPTNNPADYAALVNAFGAAIASVAPDEYFLLGGLSSYLNTNTYLTTVCQNGVLNYVNGVAIHPYIAWATPETNNISIAQIKTIINTYKPVGKTIDLICSEWGYTYDNLHAEGTASPYEATTTTAGSTNLLSHSGDVTVSPWGRIGSFTVGTGISDPFGGTAAFQVPANAGSIGYVQTGSGVVGDYYTVSVYIRSTTPMGVFFGTDFGGNMADYVYVDSTWRRYTVTVKYRSGGTRLFAIGGGSGQNHAYQFAFPQTEHRTDLNDAAVLPMLKDRQADFYVRMVKLCADNDMPYPVLYNWKDSTTNTSDEYGIVDINEAIKPAYTALKNYSAGL